MPKSRLNEYAEQLRHMIEVEQISQKDAAKRLGVHEDTVHKWCRRLCLKTQRTGPRSGDKHTGWKGGRVQIAGYWHIYNPKHPFAVHGGKYVAEHRLAMEKKISRYLLPGEVVHHLNGDRLDNSPENLVLFSKNADHLRFDLLGKRPNLTPEGKKRQQSYNQSRQHLPEEVREKNYTKLQLWKTRQLQLRRDAAQKLLPTDRLPSLCDKSDEANLS